MSAVRTYDLSVKYNYIIHFFGATAQRKPGPSHSSDL
jgi:hypothetical protein